MEADAPCVAGDHGADLQELEADGGALGAGIFAALESEPSDCIHQSVGEAGEQQAELVGPPAVAGGAVREELELLLLDAVLHLAAGAVETVVEITALAREVGHHEARVGALGAVLETRDHPAHAVPGLGAVDEFGEAALLEAARLEQAGGLRHLGFCQAHQPGVPGQADDVIHGVALAPAEQPPAAEARIRAHDDARLRPHRAQARDQQLQDAGGMLRRVDVGRSQIGDQQMVAGEDVERQEAVVVVVAVEEASLLMAVHRIVGGVDVEHDLLGRRREGGDIGLDQNPVDAPGPGPLGPVLEAAQGRRAGQHPVALGRRLHGPGHGAGRHGR